jgi:hypothetical protein
MSDETKALVKDMIINMIKNDDEAVSQNFHSALAAKMQDRVTPEVEIEVDPDDAKDENINQE